MLTKVKGKWSNTQFDIFFYFLHCNAPSNKCHKQKFMCYFLHSSNSWGMFCQLRMQLYTEFCRNSMSWLFGLGILMLWLYVPWKNALESRCCGLFVSISWCCVFVPKHQCHSFLVVESWCCVFVGLGIQMLWYICLHSLVFIFIVKTKKSCIIVSIMLLKKCFSCPNLCNI